MDKETKDLLAQNCIDYTNKVELFNKQIAMIDIEKGIVPEVVIGDISVPINEFALKALQKEYVNLANICYQSVGGKAYMDEYEKNQFLKEIEECERE